MTELDIKDHAGFIKSPVMRDIETKSIDEETGEETIHIEQEEVKGKYTYGLRYEEFIADITRFSQLIYKKNIELEEQLKEQNKQIHNLSNRLFALEEKIDALLSN